MKVLNKLILIGLLQLCLIVTVKAQDAGNFSSTALDFSRTYMGGSARMQGLGGAQTALGGDISSASSNPAGLGFFNRSEFSFSPTLNFINTTSDYLGTSTEDSRLNFNFANLGVILNKSKGDLVESKWRGGSFGISLNRIASFQNQVTYVGSSFYEYQRDTDGNIIEDADGNPLIDFDNDHPADFIESAVLNSYTNSQGDISFDNDLAELAYETYLTGVFNGVVDRDIYVTDENGNLPVDEEGNDIYTPAFPEPGYETEQRETIKSEGGIYQTSFSYGGNYDDKIYFGGGIGILSVDRDVERIYTERPTLTTLEELTLSDKYSITGVGFNATVGVIVRPVNVLLVGLKYTTPSYYSLEQNQETTLSAQYLRSSGDRSDYEEYGFVYDQFTYNISTPSRLSGGLTYFFGKNGFITGDVERVNYAGSNLSGGSDSYSFSESNNVIDNFESVYNYRVGAEYRFDIFRIRGGYSYMGDPTDNEIDESNSRVSFGAGMRQKDFFVDLGIVHSLGTESTITPYPGSRTANISNNNTAATFTVGWFF